MKIKKIRAKIVKDSRKEKTIRVIIQTLKGKFSTSAPSGKSKGEYEVESYKKSIENDVDFLNKNKEILKELEIKEFENLKKVEEILENKIGGNSLFALEASILKALAYEKGKELWEFLREEIKPKKIETPKLPMPVGNAIGGGLHTKRIKKPDFQEFLFIPLTFSFRDAVKMNREAYKLIGKLSRRLNSNVFLKKRNDEGAWEFPISNEEALEIMNKVKSVIQKKYKARLRIGVDIAASSFYKKNEKIYEYKNPERKLNKKEQLEYVSSLVKKYNIFYVEDAFEENDFLSFKKLKNKTKRSLIVGDDLTVTNPLRVKKAIEIKAINALIIKPNQIGSLLKVKEVIDLAKKNNLKTIISHRSGETLDNTIADLGVGFECDFIKTGIYGKVRESKLKRLIEIEKKIKKLKKN